MKDKDYDIVIVGAGPSCMGLIYGLLSQYDLPDQSDSRHRPSPDYNIAVIDRGPVTNNCSSTQNIKQWFKSSHDSSSSSTVYFTPAQKGLGNRLISVPAARGFGGGTTVNAGLVVRPAEDDFVDWPKYWQEEVTVTEPTGSKDDEWCHVMRSRMMASVVRVENEMMKNGTLIEEEFSSNEAVEKKCAMRGKVNHFQHYEEGLDLKELDLDLSPVFSAAKAGDDTGKNHKKKPTRVNFYQALLEPLLQRNPHLKEKIDFYQNVQAERILFDKSQDGDLVATGVECSLVGAPEGSGHQTGAFFRIMAKKRVILSGGAILSPSLLLVSGIGDEAELRQNGLTPVCPGQQQQWKCIGKKLKDHLITMKGYFVSPGFFPTNNNINSVRGWLPLDISKKREESAKECKRPFPPSAISSRILLKIMDGSSSPYIIPHTLSSTILREYDHEGLEANPSFLNLLLRVIYYVVLYFLRGILSLPPFHWILSNCTAVALVCLLNPESKGCVKVARKNQAEETAVPRLRHFDIVPDPGYLENERDHDRMEMAWNALDNVVSSWRWFQKYVEVLPGPLFKPVWGNSLRRYASDMAQPYFHWTGGCTMKTKSEQDYVVDETLKVRDVMNLYVCDASIVPTQLSAPPALTLAGIGYTAAGIFAKDLIGKEE